MVSLPRGGKVNIDTKEWNVQEAKAVTGADSLFFIHRKEKGLEAMLLDGTVKDHGQCAPEKTLTCDRIIPIGDKISYQIIGQKYHGKKTYQNYVLAFSIAKTDEKKLLPILKKLKTQMEFRQ